MTQQLDYKLIWNYFKKDKNLVKKILIFYVLFILQCIPIIGILFSAILIGYCLDNAHTRIFRPEDKLIEWNNIGRLFITGIKFFGANILLSIPFSILIVILTIPAASLASNMQTGNFSIFIFAMLYVILICILILYQLVAALAFITNLKISSFFNFKAIKFIIKNELFGAFLCKLIVLGAIFILITVVLGVTVVGYIAVPVVMFYFLAAISDLQAQFVKHVFKIKPKEQ